MKLGMEGYFRKLAGREKGEEVNRRRAERNLVAVKKVGRAFAGRKDLTVARNVKRD
jgi:hypothetical protein